MMKKLTALGLAGLMCCGLVACGDSEGGESAPGSVESSTHPEMRHVPEAMKQYVIDGQFDDTLTVTTAAGIYDGARGAIVNYDGKLPDSVMYLFADPNFVSELANRHDLTTIDELRPILHMASGTVNAYELRSPRVKSVTPSSKTEASMTVDYVLRDNSLPTSMTESACTRTYTLIRSDVAEPGSAKVWKLWSKDSDTCGDERYVMMP